MSVKFYCMGQRPNTTLSVVVGGTDVKDGDGTEIPPSCRRLLRNDWLDQKSNDTN